MDRSITALLSSIFQTDNIGVENVVHDMESERLSDPCQRIHETDAPIDDYIYFEMMVI